MTTPVIFAAATALLRDAAVFLRLEEEVQMQLHSNDHHAKMISIQERTARQAARQKARDNAEIAERIETFLMEIDQ